MIKLHFILAENVECLLQVSNVFFRFQTLDQHVIHIYFHCLAYLIFEHVVHQPLVSCPSILQTERHDLVAVKALIG